MLCGAGDCDVVKKPFDEVIANFGGEAVNYQTGNFFYENHAYSDFRKNSAMTVKNVDLCVFVVIESVGEITWDTELVTVILEGKPFILLCENQVYQRYLILKSALNDFRDLNEQDAKLIHLIHELETIRNITAVPFEITYFKEELTRQLAIIFSVALQKLAKGNCSVRAIGKMIRKEAISEGERELLIDIAKDDFEDKQIRKSIIRYLFNDGVDADTLRSLMESTEQGVQRLVFQNIGLLYKDRPFPIDLLENAVSISNNTADVGIARRYIEAVFDIDVALGIKSLLKLEITEIGVKRRIAQCLVQNKDTILSDGVVPEAIELARKCSKKGADDGWLKDISEFIEEMENLGTV